MAVPSLVVIGASAGGVEALTGLMALLPADIPAAILVVMHIAPTAPSVLSRILGRVSRLRVEPASDGAPLVAGCVYVALPDEHLLVRGDRIALVRGPRENGHRPALDPLFRSAARAHGRRVIGVVLSGNQTDGTHGLAHVKLHGGTALVQAPDEALFDGMPRSAIDAVAVDAVLPLAGLAKHIDQLARELAESEPPRRKESARLVEAGATKHANGSALARDETRDDVEFDGVGFVDAGEDTNAAMGGTLAPYTCPECHGNLWEIRDGLPVRFRCRIGHSFDEPTLVHHKDTSLETALWTAIMALEENASLARSVADRAMANGRMIAADRLARRATLLDARARTVRAVLRDLPEQVNPIADAAGEVVSTTAAMEDVAVTPPVG